jgi:hypothetical protein
MLVIILDMEIGGLFVVCGDDDGGADNISDK